MTRIQLRPGRPLLAASARPWACALLACCAILVALLGVLFAHQARADWLDQAVDSPIITWFGGHQGLLPWLAAPGSLIPAGVLSAAIVITCLLTGRLNGAVLAAAAVPVAVGLDDSLLKHLVHRTYLGVLTYPSGHTTAMFTLAAVATTLFLISPQPTMTGMLRILIPATACILGGVVAIAVIGLRWHYFTDTMAGAAVGIGTVCGIALILDRMTHGPIPPSSPGLGRSLPGGAVPAQDQGPGAGSGEGGADGPGVAGGRGGHRGELAELRARTGHMLPRGAVPPVDVRLVGAALTAAAADRPGAARGDGSR